jgi:cytochrome oxidase Cu insertion factor (SCO1/SenC/PrrC family)
MGAMFKAMETHMGQYKRYGDSFREWDVLTDSTDKAEVLEYCFENLYKRRVPESVEYHQNIRHGSGKHAGDANYYFAGYYELAKINGGYHFKVCEPYAD